MTSTAVIVLIASLAACAADVSHLSRSYLPPLSGAAGYSYSPYSSYSGNSAYSSGGYYSGSGSGLGLGLGSGYGSPLVTSGYNSYASVPQYNNYATPSRAYLPAATNYGGLDTKYAANGGYIY
ncbi:prisilkin-39 [Drosophila innubila]|uniref:prisilkin-39 n=1 Tax=Drosophila innubila TaxID=198719 RepID=UPI00148DC10D|nr:prisilkin-39 [Drosophila innubila]